VRPVRGNRGATLIEVLVALVILAVVGMSLLCLANEALRLSSSAREKEYSLVDQERLLTAYALLTRHELDQRLGERRIGPYLVTVQRPEPTLYRISVGELVTVTYHPVQAR